MYTKKPRHLFQEPGFVCQLINHCGRSRKPDYFCFCFSCFSFLFSLSDLAGFFLTSFLLSLALDIYVLLNFACPVEMRLLKHLEPCDGSRGNSSPLLKLKYQKIVKKVKKFGRFCSFSHLKICHLKFIPVSALLPGRERPVKISAGPSRSSESSRPPPRFP